MTMIFDPRNSFEDNTLPSAYERLALQQANDADQEYLLQLRRRIDTRRIFTSKLRSSYYQVNDRLNRRSALISPHRFVPDELLSYIFTFVDYEPYHRIYNYSPRSSQPVDSSLISPGAWKLRSPLNLCRVSRRWRHVACETPQLWGNLVVDTQKWCPEEMMEHWFRHAKAVPVNVTIWHQGPSARPQGRGSVESALLSTVITIGNHIRQIGSLRIACPDIIDGWRGAQDLGMIFKIFELIKKPLWKTLVIDCMDAQLTGGASTSLLPAALPQFLQRLTTLHIRGFLPAERFFSTEFPKLTTLKLDLPASGRMTQKYSDLYLDVLSLLRFSLPNLRRLRLKGRDLPISIRPAATFDGLVELPKLEELTIAGYYFASYLPWLVAPNLRKLKLKGETYASGSVDEQDPLVQWDGVHVLVSTFLKQSGAMLTEFSLSGIGKGLKSNGLAGCLQLMPGLRRLRIIELPGTDILNVSQDVLTLTVTNGHCSDQWMLFCPVLDRIEWHVRNSPRSVDWKVLLCARPGLTVIHLPPKPALVVY